MDKLEFVSSDNQEIRFRRWLPEGEVRAILLIFHGMAEHSERYSDFAEFMNHQGFAVFAPDHRGHGLTAASLDNLGYFSIENGWNKVVQDLISLKEIAQGEHREKPLFLLAHSMGSFLARDMLSREGESFSGVILSGTGYVAPLLARVMRSIASMEIKRFGDRHPSQRLNGLSFGTYNRKFKPVRTEFDWLSRDEEQVDKYIADDYCGFICTSGLYNDLAGGLSRIADPNQLQGTPKDLPLLLYSGDQDPLYPGVSKVMKLYRKLGMTRLELKTNPGGRHESLNETNRSEVYRVFLDYYQSLL